MLSCSVGRKDGVTEEELSTMRRPLAEAQGHLSSILNDVSGRKRLGLEWAMLPFQGKDTVKRTQDLGDEIADSCDNVISLGIGGSYLGLKAAQDALAGAYYNDFSKARRGRPRIYFDGNNMDPDTLTALIKNLDPARTFVVVISKSGETTETKAAFAVVERWLKKGAGGRYGRRIIAITDPESGTLRARVESEQSIDGLGFRNLPVLKGVGGRFSELNVGLLHLAIIGVDIRRVLEGAASMYRRCMERSLMKNPASMYAALQTILYRRKGKPISIMMPFSERLKSTADWYVQLLAESLGKKYARGIRRTPDGEVWVEDRRRVLNIGRTPIPARGTNDLHSIQQNNIEGENNKTVTFIKVEDFHDDIEVAGTGDFLEGKKYSRLLAIAEEATEWALVREARPNCAVIMPELSPFYWGALIFFFEMATAIEGELLGVNAFDQPGVEGYKNYMYYKLGKRGISGRVAEDIEKSPLIKKPGYIL
jgi:glucose-6-phosphate isomerase